MLSVNKTTLMGHLGCDPEVRYTPTGTAVCTVSLTTPKHGPGPRAPHRNPKRTTPTCGTYAREVFAVAGAVVTLDYSGSAANHRGLIRPEDRAEAKKAVSVASGRGNDSQEEESKSAKALISEPSQRKLTAHRTMALQVRLADNWHVALAAVVYVLLQQVIKVGYVRSALGVPGSGCAGTLEQAASDMKEFQAFAEMASRLDPWRDHLPGDSDKLLPWLIGQDQDALLQHFALFGALRRYGDEPRANPPGRRAGERRRAGHGGLLGCDGHELLCAGVQGTNRRGRHGGCVGGGGRRHP